jgi:DNA-binding transcriptional MerR regulator
MSKLLAIGAIARAAGVTPDTIRYYERLGLLPTPARTAAGYRQYSEGVLNRLSVVRNAQQFGFSLREIAGFLRVRDRGGKPCQEVRAAAQRMLDAMAQQIVALQSARTRMRETLRAWDRTLERTPGDRPARLLEALSGNGRGTSRGRGQADRLRRRASSI